MTKLMKKRIIELVQKYDKVEFLCHGKFVSLPLKEIKDKK